MPKDRRGKLHIQKGTGKAKCQYCGDPITEEELEVKEVGTGNTWRFDKHYHLHGVGGDCQGWIWHNWDFITRLLHQLAEVGGNDYVETIDMMIAVWEEGP